MLDEQGRVEAAIECLRTALRVAPDYTDAMFNLALVLQRTNQYAEATVYWRRYLASDYQSEWAARGHGERPVANAESASGLFARTNVFFCLECLRPPTVIATAYRAKP
jgi:tetratricopeptide (TPR) repeat protein